MSNRIVRVAASVAAVFALGVAAVAQPCVPQFYGGFPALDGAVRAMTVFDDGSGPALYIGGAFTTAANGSDAPVSRVAKWTGAHWASVGGGVNGTVYALQVWDDGLGGGPGLYVGGVFDQAGGVPVRSIARWDAMGWNDVGGGVDYAPQDPSHAEVHALALYDEGAGLTLFAAGDFDRAGGVRVWSIARWNGEAWSVVGPERSSSVPNYFKPINAMTTFFDPVGGSQLFVGGSFVNYGPGTFVYPGLARWNGIQWNHLLGQGAPYYLTFTYAPTGNPPEYGGVYALTTSIDEGQPTLFIGGRFTSYPGSVSSPSIARYRPPSVSYPQLVTTYLSPINQSAGADAVYSMSAFNDGTAFSLLVGGEFFGGGYGNRLVRYIGNGNVASVGPNSLGLNGPVYALASPIGPVAPGLYIGGAFTSAGGVNASRIARFGCEGSDQPTAFPLVSPVNNAVAESRGPTFQWAAPGSASPLSYSLRVYADAAMTQQAYAADNIVGLSHAPPAGALSAGTRYWWKVSAFNVNGSTMCSAPFSFATRSIGDADGNGLVDFIDLNAVLSAFGQAP